MTNSENFRMLVDMALKMGGRTHMRPVIEKELLHYDILFALDKAGLLEPLTFQGGTCLRLCYGAFRFSEDLDFVGGRDFSTLRLKEMKSCLENYIGRRYGLTVDVKEPHELTNEPEYRGLKVDKWRITVITAPDERYMPRQRIKIEVANIPAYSREPRDLKTNYDFLPDGYSDTLVLAETLDEIMADKLISLVNCQAYIRYRDIWDLRWLLQQGANPDAGLIRAKIDDYRAAGYLGKLDAMISRLPDIIRDKAFHDQMSRFLPLDVQERTLRKEKFYIFLTNEISHLLDRVKEIASQAGD